jgi:hypothetical protein
MQLADGRRIKRRRNASVADIAQQLLQQKHNGPIIIDNQNAGVKNFLFANHRSCPLKKKYLSGMLSNISASWQRRIK